MVPLDLRSVAALFVFNLTIFSDSLNITLPYYPYIDKVFDDSKTHFYVDGADLELIYSREETVPFNFNIFYKQTQI